MLLASSHVVRTTLAGRHASQQAVRRIGNGGYPATARSAVSTTLASNSARVTGPTPAAVRRDPPGDRGHIAGRDLGQLGIFARTAKYPAKRKRPRMAN